MKKTLIIISGITLFTILFQSCQKSAKIDLGNFPKTWFFFSVKDGGEGLAFRMSCEEVSTRIEIKTNTAPKG